MGIATIYTCDETGAPCDDADILADATGATQRVVLNASVYFNNGDAVSVQNMGTHVFASIDDAIAWAQKILVPAVVTTPAP